MSRRLARCQSPRARRRDRRHRQAHGGGLGRPVVALGLAVAPWPVTVLATRGHTAAVLLTLLGLTLTGAAAATVGRYRWRARVLREHEHLEHAGRTLRLVYQDWLDGEAQRGVAELDRWRRTHSP